MALIVESGWMARCDDVGVQNGSNGVAAFDNDCDVLLVLQWFGLVTCRKYESALLKPLSCLFSVANLNVDGIVTAAPHRDDIGDVCVILIATNFSPIWVDVGVTLNVAANLCSDVGEWDEYDGNDDSVPFFELNDDELICDTADAVEPFEWNDDKIDCVLGDE